MSAPVCSICDAADDGISVLVAACEECGRPACDACYCDRRCCQDASAVPEPIFSDTAATEPWASQPVSPDRPSVEPQQPMSRVQGPTTNTVQGDPAAFSEGGR